MQHLQGRLVNFIRIDSLKTDYVLHNFYRLDSYVKENRNLKHVDDSQRRFRLLQLGKLDVVSFLTKLPKTSHDPRSLVVDVPVASVGSIP